MVFADRLGNNQDGILIDGALDTVIGGSTDTTSFANLDPTTASPLNVIAGNLGNGIHITGTAKLGTIVGQ